jgi:hypothetical protein
MPHKEHATARNLRASLSEHPRRGLGIKDIVIRDQDKELSPSNDSCPITCKLN